MNAKTRHEIDKRINNLTKPTKEQTKILEERIKRHKDKYGTLDHQGLFKKLAKLFF